MLGKERLIEELGRISHWRSHLYLLFNTLKNRELLCPQDWTDEQLLSVSFSLIKYDVTRRHDPSLK